MAKWILIGCILSLVGFAQDAPAVDKASDELAAACDKLAKAESYTFRVEMQSEGSPFGGGGERGRRSGGGSDTPVIGRFHKAQPVQLERGDLEAYRMDRRLVYRDSEGEWTTFGRRSGFGGPGGRGRGEGGEPPSRRNPGGREGGRGGAGGGERGGRGGDREAMMALMSISRITAPHENLGGIDDKVQDVRKSMDGGQVVYSATLTESGARAFGGFGMPRGRRSGGMGGGDDAPETKGTIRVTVGKDGTIETIVVHTETKMSFGERTMDMKRTTTYTVSDVGATKVDVPDEARKMLEEPDDAGGEEREG